MTVSLRVEKLCGRFKAKLSFYLDRFLKKVSMK